MKAHFILYVSDQEASRRFYAAVLEREPDLHVPGMTEFHLGEGTVLGLMPGAGISRLLSPRLPAVAAGRDSVKAELYLHVDDPGACHRRALDNGAEELSALEPRDWGDDVAYSLDPDGHVLAFARASAGRATE